MYNFEYYVYPRTAKPYTFEKPSKVKSGHLKEIPLLIKSKLSYLNDTIYFAIFLYNHLRSYCNSVLPLLLLGNLKKSLYEI